MDEKGHKKKQRKRESVELPLSKQKKHTHGDSPPLDHTTPIEPLTEEHAQLLDSVKGHLKELTQVTDSYQDFPESDTEVVSKSSTKKSKKKDEISELPSEEKSTVATKEFALEYLRLWNEEKKKWSFKKKTQFWLLQNMYRKSNVGKDLVMANFTVFLFV